MEIILPIDRQLTKKEKRKKFDWVTWPVVNIVSRIIIFHVLKRRSLSSWPNVLETTSQEYFKPFLSSYYIILISPRIPAAIKKPTLLGQLDESKLLPCSAKQQIAPFVLFLIISSGFRTHSYRHLHLLPIALEESNRL